MEYYEGASYRINIEGYDSTLILDGYTRTLKANIIDQNDNMMVDHETGTLYGTLVGNIVDNESNVVYDSETKSIAVEQIQGSLINTHGDIVYDHYQSIFKGDFVGNFSGNLLSGETVIFDHATNVINASLYGSIMTSEGGVAYDHERNIFQGTFVGNFLDQDGNLIFSSSDPTQNYNDNQILHQDGTIAVDLTSKVFSGDLCGNTITQDGYVLLNAADETLYGNVRGNIIYTDGTTAIDGETRTIQGNFIGNIYNEEGLLVLDNEKFEVNANLTGNVLAVDGTVIVDNQTQMFIGTLSGSLVGDIINADGLVVFDTENSTFRMPVQADVIGSLIGDVIDADGIAIINYEDKIANLNTVNANDVICSNITGTLLGDICNSTGEIVLDVETKQFAGSLLGDIVDANNNLAYDSSKNTFYGNFDGRVVAQGEMYVNNLTVGHNVSGTLAIHSETDIEDNNGPLSIYTYKDTSQYSAITLTKARGSIDNVLPVQAGDGLNAIWFAAQNGIESDNKSMVGGIGARVPDDAEISADGIPGEMRLVVNGYNNELIDGFVVDANGYMKTTLKELSIVGNTNNVPNDSTTKSKWLELKVNGEVMFIPLYS